MTDSTGFYPGFAFIIFLILILLLLGGFWGGRFETEV